MLARSVGAGGGTFTRRYPAGELFSHAVGYSFTNIGRAGLEREYNDPLTGRETELVSAVDSILGQDREGDDLRTTLDPAAQRVALQGLGGRKGAVVALDVDTGRVRVMASVPGFDPNGLDQAGRLERLNTDSANSPLFNRATQIGYPPGSTFKVVTAAAALDAGRFTPGSVVDGSSPKTISGVPLNNSGDQSFGPIDLTTALTNSVNTVWAQVGVDVGRGTMGEYMEKFGFYAKPPLDYPADQLDPSGAYRRGRPVRPSSSVGRPRPAGDRPVHPARDAAADGHGRPDDRQRRRAHGAAPGRPARRPRRAHVRRDRAARAPSAWSAPEPPPSSATMMRNVVREGTGTAAALEGVEVAGKTGTAEVDVDAGINDPWFIGFTDRTAVAVVVERVQGQGGTVAAPIAKAVLQALER